MQDYEDYPATVISHAKGVWLYKKDGAKILDAISSWWVNIFGHGNKFIAREIKKQAKKLEHVIFANYTHESAVRLSEKLSGLFDHRLPKIFFTDNGSSAVEVALKMSFQYRQIVGETRRTRFAYISDGYHGETVGALSVGSLGLYKKIFEPMLMDTLEAPGPDCFRCPYDQKRYTCDAECFEKTRRFLAEHSQVLSAIIIEPILQVAGGMKIYPAIFLKKIRELCSQLNIHLICDEIASGFGRTGKIMASHHAQITPDFVCLSKGLTGGFLPLAAVLTSNEIFEAFYAPYLEHKAFMHSHSYTGNPIATRAACAVMDLFEKTNILKKSLKRGDYIRERAQKFLSHKNVGEIRSIGMVTAIELVKNRKTRESLDGRNRTGYRIYRRAESKGVLLRNLGDVIYFMPPLVIKKKEIDFMVDVAFDSMRKILK